mgnify:CR=1 FL=1
MSHTFVGESLTCKVEMTNLGRAHPLDAATTLEAHRIVGSESESRVEMLVDQRA